MFDNKRQMNRACMALLRHRVPRHAELWDEDDGPTGLAWSPPPWSSGEIIMLRVALAVWNGDDSVTVADLMRLDSSNLWAVSGLLGALAGTSATIEAWIARQDVSVGSAT